MVVKAIVGVIMEEDMVKENKVDKIIVEENIEVMEDMEGDMKEKEEKDEKYEIEENVEKEEKGFPHCLCHFKLILSISPPM